MAGTGPADNAERMEPVNGERPKIKRKRAVHVCGRCKELKLKCDLGQPCGACIKARTIDRCVYKPWRDGEGNNDNIPSSLAARVQQLERQLASAQTVADFAVPVSIHQPPPSPTSDLDEWPSILSAFPAPDVCRALLDRFYLFDISFRTTHVPSFKRQVEHVLSSIASLPPSDASFVARMVVSMMVGLENNVSRATGITSPPTRLSQLYRRIMHYIEESASTDPEVIGMEYVATLHMDVYRYVRGNDSSIKLAWISIGRAVNAALLLKLDVEPLELDPNMGFFEAEMRRRLWWQISISERYIAEQTGLPPTIRSLRPSTRPPTIIPDDQLDSPYPTPPGTAQIPEWSYILSKIDFSALLGSLPRPSLPPAPDAGPNAFSVLQSGYDAIETFRAALPPHLRIETPIQPADPPWVYAQACIHNIGINHGIIRLLRPAVQSSDATLQMWALPLALSAARDLVETAQTYITHVLFRWRAGMAFNIWTFGNKVFQAALIIAYALFSAPGVAADEYNRRLLCLNTAIGALGIMTSEEQKCELNDKALAILRRLCARIDERQMGLDETRDEQVIDPYTGNTVRLVEHTPPARHEPYGPNMAFPGNEQPALLLGPSAGSTYAKFGSGQDDAIDGGLKLSSEFGGTGIFGETTFADLLNWDHWQAVLTTDQSC